jgi:type IV pilus assembly protein PilC
MASPALLRLASVEHQLTLRRELLDAILAPLAAKASLPEALTIAASEHPSRSMRSVLGHVAREIYAGRPLSDALAEVEPVADDALVAAARAGERSGRLDDALRACERLVDVRLAAARGVSDAIVQPMLSIACAVAVVVLLLLVGTIPAMLGGVAQEGAIVATLTVIGAHPRLASAGLMLLVIGIVIGVRVLLMGRRGDDIVARIPVIGPLRMNSSLGLICRQVALLVETGVPLQDALESSAHLLPRGSMRDAIHGFASRLLSGEPPERAAAGVGETAPMLAAVLSAPGSHDVPSRLARLARWHEAEALRLAEVASAGAGAVAIVAAMLACGTVVILAWSGYFAMASHFVD